MYILYLYMCKNNEYVYHYRTELIKLSLVLKQILFKILFVLPLFGYLNRKTIIRLLGLIDKCI